MKYFIFSLALISGVVCEIEEAPYTVIKEHDGWEERAYPATRWVSSDGFGVFPHDGPEGDKAFYRLFNYIDGGNSASLKIAMTAPVSFRILPGEGPNCESNFTMSFLVPADLQVDTPTPNDPLVYLEDRPAFNVAVLRFGGFPTELVYTEQAANLYELMAAEGFNAQPSPVWTAGYDGPNVIINRRNEVWLEY